MRAQITLFVIVAILIVSAVGIVYYASSTISKAALNKEQAIIKAVPEKFRPAEINFLSCLKSKAQDSLTILGSQAGYVNLPAEDPASDYMPFSNTLSFVGLKIPYWWYVSGNNIQKNQIPSTEFMQNEMQDYVNAHVQECESSLRLLEGYELTTEKAPETKVTINDEYVDFEINYPIKLQYEDAAATVQKHMFAVPFELGKLYKISRQIMDKESENYFIEERTIDMIFIYPEIPSTSINFECSPRIWTKSAVAQSLKTIVENNVPFIRIKGTSYGKAEKYFEIDAGKTDSSVRVNMLAVTSPFKFDVSPSDGELLKGEPMIGEGENEALDFIKNIFCISSYHFIYSVSYPVLIQLTDKNGNIFQFPVLVVIANNQPKENRYAGEGITIVPELCSTKLAKETVNTFTSENGNISPLNGVDISFKCIATTCKIGQTSTDGTITAQFPQCLNGELSARKEGYHPEKYIMSTNFNDQEVSLTLEKYMNFTLNVSVIEKDGRTRRVKSDETVILEMKNDVKSHNVNVIYPSQENVYLLSGDYSAKLSLFEKGSFELKGQQVSQCTNVPKEGIFGFMGFMEEKCISFETPNVNLEQVFGGGAEFPITIREGKVLNLYLLKTDAPKTVDELNSAYQTSQTAASNQLFKQPELT
jgi:hypothetical protein